MRAPPSRHHLDDGAPPPSGPRHVRRDVAPAACPRLVAPPAHRGAPRHRRGARPPGTPQTVSKRAGQGLGSHPSPRPPGERRTPRWRGHFAIVFPGRGTLHGGTVGVTSCCFLLLLDPTAAAAATPRGNPPSELPPAFCTPVGVSPLRAGRTPGETEPEGGARVPCWAAGGPAKPPAPSRRQRLVPAGPRRSPRRAPRHPHTHPPSLPSHGRAPQLIPLHLSLARRRP